MNRLADALSPYLRQHAHNPVDWYPWGDEALQRARDEDRPLLVSIGYSACHWCHVMERESFDDPAIAARMNALFVNVKVDREERPDLDQVYQLAVQLLQRRPGGWPLTVFLTPDLTPFFGGTYFPPEDRFGMPGFPKVLEHVARIYAEKRDAVAGLGADLAAAIERATTPSPGALLPERPLEDAARKLAERFDRRRGGFGTQPKFPSPSALDLLLRVPGAAREHALLTLDAMRLGGVYDHLGGGFHRYSTDARWLVPHFEKMLYDNAQLARSYADAARLLGASAEAPGERFGAVARDVCTWVEREMTHPEGAFFATQDADSDDGSGAAKEGAFFVWTRAELDALLAPEEVAVAAPYFGVREKGNFEEGASVLHVATPLAEVAQELALEPAEAVARLERAAEKMLAKREERARPFRDEKILAAWNGLMISGFAEAGMALGDAELVDRAARALDWVRRTLWKDRVLRRLWKDGALGGEGFLEDYGLVACAALDVYEASFDEAALDFARALVAAADVHFREGDALYFAPASGDLFVRARGAMETALPSGLAAHAEACVRLHALDGEPGEDGPTSAARVEALLRAHGEEAAAHPFGHARLLQVVDRWVAGPTEVTVVAARAEEAAPLADVARRAAVPRRALRWLRPEEAGARERPAGERPRAYVCRGRVCSSPLEDPEALAAALAEG